jgi:hypothetical protein
VAEALEWAEKGAEPGFNMVVTYYYRGLCKMETARHESFRAFEALVDRLWWIIRLRLRQYLAHRRDPAGRAGAS